MSQLILPRRFTRQPQDAVDIDWGNPLTQGLIAGFTGTSLFDATGRNKIVLAGTGAIGATDKGLALIGNNSSATGSLAIDLSPYRGFSYSGWFECPSTYNSYDMLFEYTADLNSTTGGFCILQNSGNYELVIRTTSGYGQVNSPIAFGMNYLTYKVDLDATTNTTQQILYVNGVKRVTTPISTGVHNGAFPNSLLYLMSRGNTSLQLNGRIVGFALHGRAISDSEARELADNHWQLFRAKPRVLYFDVGGGATAVDSDLSDSYVLRAAVSSDLSDSYAIRAAIAADFADSYAVLSSVAADLADSYAITASVNVDLADSYLIRASVAQDLADSYALRASIASDLADSYTIENAGTVSSDLSDSYLIRAAIASDLSDSAAIRAAVLAEIADEYTVRSSVSQDLADQYAVIGSVRADLDDSYVVRAAVAQDLIDSYTVFSGSGTGATAEEIVAAIWANSQINPIWADIRKVNGIVVDGSGTEIDPWGPV